MKIKDIKNSKFLKDYDINKLLKLSSDMRKFILEKVSQNGGHLSSNLGIIELTIALLKIFDEEQDVFLFDVGHNSYPYKILTGRAKEFDSLRKLNGLSGFQSKSESKVDYYETGHSSTSISTGIGYAIARDIDKRNKRNIISVIGDGSISNGLAYEALNHLGDLKTKQIIILNDNQMSISKNVGAIHNMLDSIRAGKSYNKAKKNTKKLLGNTKFGRKIEKFLENIKNNLKKIYLKEGTLFSDFGVEYYGPIDGHDYKELLHYLQIVKNEEKPVLLHVITVKGKGYSFAEEDDVGAFHGIGTFNLLTGKEKIKNTLPSYSEIISTYLYKFMKKDDDIMCITPGMCYGSKLGIIKEKLPKNFIDVGIAEEHGLVLANGLALAGKKPYIFIYSTFFQRGYDQVVHDIARCNSDVTIMIDRAGLVPSDGPSHQGVFDIPMMLSIPNIIITMPKDAQEANDLIYTSLNYIGPFIIRYPKINIENNYNKAQLLKIGSWEILTKGNDGYIISYGPFIEKALNITNKLKKDNIKLSVINARFIKPLDEKMLKEIIKNKKPIFIYEESMKTASLGSIIAIYLTEKRFNGIFKIFGIEDTFIPHGNREELLKLCKLDEDNIYINIKKYFKK